MHIHDEPHRASPCTGVALCLSAVALMAGAAFGNNGYVAIGLPVSNITVDGDLSDWPLDTKRHPLRCNHFGDGPTSQDDLSAWFMAGYDLAEQQLYVAMEVHDDSLVSQGDSEEEKWKSRDSAGIYLAINHGPAGQPVDDSYSVTSDNATLESHCVRAVSKRSDDVSRFEWVVDLRTRVQSTIDLAQPFTIALCADAIDVDADGSISIRYWTPCAWKQQSADRAGDLILGVRPDQLGTIEGRLTDATSQNPIARTLVRLVSRANPNLVIDVMTDTEGCYRTQLPRDDYLRSTPDWPHDPHESVVRIYAGVVTEDELSIETASTVVQLQSDRVLPTREPSRKRIKDEVTNHTYELRSFTVANGLPNGVNQDLAVDAEGCVWIANTMGLAKLSGNQTITFDDRSGLPSKIVNCLFYEDEESFWIGTDDGLACISTSSESVTIIPELTGKSIIHVGRLHDGTLGVSTDRGLFTICGNDIKAHRMTSEPGATRCLTTCPDPSREFSWVGTDGGVVKFDGTEFTEHLSCANGLPDNRVWRMLVDRSGNIWFGGNRSIFCFDGDTFTTIRTHASETYRHCSSLFKDAQGLVWATTFTTGHTTVVVAYSDASPAGLAQEFRTGAARIERDPFDNVWIMNRGAVSQLQRNRIRIAEQPCSAVAVRPAKSAGDDIVWFASQNESSTWYLHCIAGSGNRLGGREVRCPGEVSTLVAHATKPEGVWVGTVKHGLMLFDGNELHYPHQQRPTSQLRTTTMAGQDRWPTTSRVFDLKYLTAGQLWCATADGIYVIEGERVVAVYSNATGLPTSRIDDIDECPSGCVVCGSLSGVLFIDSTTGELLGRIGEQQGLPDNFAPTVKVGADGSIWIGTFHGLYRYRDYELESLGDTPGLLQTRIHKIQEDSTSLIWVTSEMGITKISPATGIGQAFLRRSQTSPAESFHGVAFGDTSNWVASSDGLMQCRTPNAIPRLVFDSAETDRPLEANGTIHSNSDAASVRFGFHAVSLSTDQKDFTFVYRLKNHDATWRTTKENVVRYATPKPGMYYFEAFAYDRDLIQSNLVRVAYKVSPPYVRWIKTSALSLSTVTCVLLGLMYVAKVHRDNRELEERAEKRAAEALAAQKEQQRLHIELLHAQKMESLGTMAAGMAHDFNNALCAIASNAELGLMRLKQPQKVASSLNEVVSATHQAAGLTKSLLTFAGKSTADKQPFHLQDLVEESIKMIRGTIPASIQVNTQLQGTPIWCDVDAGQMKQVLVNLTMNARDAMPDGGILSVEVFSADNVDTISGTEAVLMVGDNGCGMDALTISRMFEPFYTSKPRGKGTGLGLSIAHSIVTAHNGQIVVESERGKGTTFEVRLPTCPAPVDEPMNSESSSPDVRHLCGSVIVADDEPRVREALVKAFETVGLRVSGVSDGAALVRLGLREINELALVVADIDMPKLDGISAIRQLQEVDEDLPAIIITGMSTEIPSDAHAGPTLFMRKPFPLRDLLANTRLLARDTVKQA